MHELSIMENALNLALETAAEANATRICALRLRVGPFSGVVPEALRFAFEVLSKGTLAEGAQLEIAGGAETSKCISCGEEYPVAFGPWCPACGKPPANQRAGRELELESVEVE